MKRASKSNLLTAMISASMSLTLTGQSATAAERVIPFSSVLYTDGAAAQCRFHVLNNASSMLCNIIDNKFDQFRPYVEWEVEDYGTIRKIYSPGDAGVIRQIKDYRVERGNINYFNWRVCGKTRCSIRLVY